MIQTQVCRDFWRYYHEFSVLLGVVSATVNVLCELARRSPEDYLALAPQLFQLLTSSTNNWMLIKIIKLVSGFLDHLCLR